MHHCPIKMTVPLNIARVQIETVDADEISSMQVLDDIAANYRYDGVEHALRLDRLRYGQSNAQARVQLHARNLALSARLTASLQDLVPDTPFSMLVQFEATGTLAGGDAAALDLRLDASERADPGAQIHAQATVHPGANSLRNWLSSRQAA